MSGMLEKFTLKTLAIAMGVILAVAALLSIQGAVPMKRVSADFASAVSVYKGSEVRIMGVKVGEVTAVVPNGESIRVSMEFDAKYKVPADVKALIITPTLVADRYVQLAPAYSSGPELGNDANIPLAATGSPVELDRIYKSLLQLTTALGPNGVNRNGTLNHLLAAGDKVLRGRGKLANETILNMSAAVRTFGNNAGPLFSSVRNMSAITTTLAANDQVVNQFIKDFAQVSTQLASERVDISQALKALARTLSTVKGFVKQNKGLLRQNLESVTRITNNLLKHKEVIAQVLEEGPLAIGNLNLGFDSKTGTMGSRIQIGPTFEAFDGFLCATVVNYGIPGAQELCKLFKQLLQPGAGRQSNQKQASQTKVARPKVATSLEQVLGVTK